MSRVGKKGLKKKEPGSIRDSPRQTVMSGAGAQRSLTFLHAGQTVSCPSTEHQLIHHNDRKMYFKSTRHSAVFLFPSFQALAHIIHLHGSPGLSGLAC